MLKLSIYSKYQWENNGGITKIIQTYRFIDMKDKNYKSLFIFEDVRQVFRLSEDEEQATLKYI